MLGVLLLRQAPQERNPLDCLDGASLRGHGWRQRMLDLRTRNGSVVYSVETFPLEPLELVEIELDEIDMNGPLILCI